MKVKVLLAFTAGVVVSSLLWFAIWQAFRSIPYSLRKNPEQIPFNSELWKTSDSSVRAHMYKDLIKYLETKRPKRDKIVDLLGPSGHTNSAYLNGADYFYVYQLDLGQRMSGIPFLDKLGIAFDENENYSHTVIWD